MAQDEKTPLEKLTELHKNIKDNFTSSTIKSLLQPYMQAQDELEQMRISIVKSGVLGQYQLLSRDLVAIIGESNFHNSNAKIANILKTDKQEELLKIFNKTHSATNSFKPEKKISEPLMQAEELKSEEARKIINSIKKLANDYVKIVENCLSNNEKLKATVFDVSLNRIVNIQTNLSNKEAFKSQLLDCKELWSPLEVKEIYGGVLYDLIKEDHGPENHIKNFARKIFDSVTLESKNNAIIKNPAVLDVIDIEQKTNFLKGSMKGSHFSLKALNEVVISEPAIFNRLDQKEQKTLIRNNIVNPTSNSNDFYNKIDSKIAISYPEISDRHKFLKETMKELTGVDIAKAMILAPKTSPLIRGAAEHEQNKIRNHTALNRRNDKNKAYKHFLKGDDFNVFLKTHFPGNKIDVSELRTAMLSKRKNANIIADIVKAGVKNSKAKEKGGFLDNPNLQDTISSINKNVSGKITFIHEDGSKNKIRSTAISQKKVDEKNIHDR